MMAKTAPNSGEDAVPVRSASGINHFRWRVGLRWSDAGGGTTSFVVMGLTSPHQSTGWHFDDVAQVGRTALDGRNTDAPRRCVVSRIDVFRSDWRRVLAERTYVPDNGEASDHGDRSFPIVDVGEKVRNRHAAKCRNKWLSFARKRELRYEHGRRRQRPNGSARN